MDTPSVEATVSSIAAKASGGGTATSIFGWMTSNELMALLGVVIAFCGFVVNFIFKYREDKRQQELHSSQLAALHHKDP